jgi:hypothetical protein|tara:strand:- start:51 stop:716 length:666 start_codon:yes stop_codon:yes gene_type:complete
VSGRKVSGIKVSEPKIFIIGLPRTATTSVCLALLKMGYKTAHNAYTAQSFIDAQILADTPIFCDYQQLDKHFPQSKFIYLTREKAAWTASIKQLLQRMIVNLQRPDGGFNPHLKRCYNEIFSPLSRENIEDDDFLHGCYLRHHQGIESYFANRKEDLLTIDVNDEDSFDKMISFLSISKENVKLHQFERINMGGKVRAWQDINNPLKVESTKKGRIDKVLY